MSDDIQTAEWVGGSIVYDPKLLQLADALRVQCQRLRSVLRTCRGEDPALFADAEVRMRVIDRRLDESKAAMNAYDEARRITT